MEGDTRASSQRLQRVIQESVPGKQVTIAHVIASPGPEINERIGVEAGDAIGIMTLTPSETAIIAADFAVKAAPVTVGFLDRFTGSVVILGDVDSVECALVEVNKMLHHLLGFTVVSVTKS